MAYDIPPFVSRDGDALVFNQADSTFIFYVPEKYFTTKDAIMIGDIVNMLGIINYEIVDKNGKSTTGLKLFNFPTAFLTQPSEIVKEKDLKLTPNSKPMDYRVFKYYKGAKIVISVKVPEQIENVEALYNLLIRGNLPNTIPYDELQNIVWQNMSLNGYKYGITMQLIGLLISELYRGSKDINIPFRLSKSNDMLDYQAIDIRQVPKHISPFVSLTSENWDESVVGAMMIDKPKDSPMEKLLMD